MKSWSLKQKLMVLCFFQATIPLIIGGISFFGLKRISSSYELVSGRALANIEISNQMYLEFKNIRVNLRSLGISNISPTNAAEYIAEVKKNIQAYEKYRVEYQKTAFLPGEEVVFLEVDRTWEKFKALGGYVLSAYASNDSKKYEEVLGIFSKDCPLLAGKYEKAMQSLVAFHDKNAETWIAQARRNSQLTDMIAMVTNIVGLVLGLAAGAWVAFSVSRSISEITVNLGSEADGVGVTAEKINVSSKDLSQASSSQAASLEETVATMEEMTSMVKVSAGNAKSAALLADDTQKSAVRGESEVKLLVESMRAIAQDSKKIAEITGVIDDIAFQTNLLALNAAVEAARAGEQGRSFAVVADAVRGLAKRSADSAHHITALIQESAELIDKGLKQAEVGGEVLNEVVNSIRKVADLNQEISNASEEQAVGIQQIGKALNDLDQVTQQNASASEEASTCADQLESQSVSMRQYVGNLNKIIKGNRAA